MTVALHSVLRTGQQEAYERAQAAAATRADHGRAGAVRGGAAMSLYLVHEHPHL